MEELYIVYELTRGGGKPSVKWKNLKLFFLIGYIVLKNNAVHPIQLTSPFLCTPY